MKTKIEQHVIDAVKKKRLEQNISQATLAFCLNVSKGFIGDVESPKMRAKYNLNHINELAKFFNCSPREFLPESFFDEDAL
ncbi:helix-turn-helix transcriptional regulator [uncultured Acetobacteroides sp.]|uniref:helix-turn-helix domain-containing protein n=1 Tax=uncultured Acetobacteroides sp. TaxID=1760811 RepID=UPI0029F51959|nr:helix-turn-helix transcriptional regulator [uncultured Acetobacteroides sp.]